MAPKWKDQIWHPPFEKIIVGRPFILTLFLLLPYNQERHLLAENIILVATIL